MSSPLTDATSNLASSALHDLSPRQRLESALEKLPAPGSVLGQAQGNTKAVTPGELVEPIQRINEVMRKHGIEFDMSEGSSRVITRIVDRDSGDVIRQIPAEEVLRVAEHLDELQGRLLHLQA
ncbi:flagellar protein FlaG [Halomonas sp. Bachu 37]|uniref:flagellar protein FlaG n=1 Tax=Halomonas kashgarensis TaxID=3084920 RepID=UPI0032163198